MFNYFPRFRHWLIALFWGSVCRWHTDDKFTSLRVRWHQLRSIRLHILSLLHGKSLSSHIWALNIPWNISSLKIFLTMNQCSNENLQVGVAAISIPCLVYLSAHNGFIGIWIALTIYMSLRTIASTWRYISIGYTTALSALHCSHFFSSS